MNQQAFAMIGDGALAQRRRAPETKNLLLESLSADDFALLAPSLERVPFRIGEVLARAGTPISNVFFFEGAIAGVLDSLEGDRRFAVGLIGREGFAGKALLLGDDRWPYDIVMRAEPGDLLRCPADALLAAFERSETLRLALLRYVHVFMLQMGRTIVSSLAHSIERRMARWILLYHDRVRGDDICMTHEEFRLMMGVRRASITDALHRLEEAQAVWARRGRITVRDRAKLIALAGDTYGPAERDYRRLISPHFAHDEG
ncbi:Crp/Fnr family transcriptional regulator [Sphingomonas jinjuensis]|uniref:Crp/Fnr family transcriptional regulator n=1 Tax=Sphingomonas jinjuensis TaxID=535907 RepID=UPI001C85C071|nr:helix-turn-helix domain-containing protein [Sphingomonas jinjuensis]